MAEYNQVKHVGVKPTVKAAQDGGSTVLVETTSTTILAANDDRTSFRIRNVGSADIYISFSGTATIAAWTLKPGDTIFDDDYTGEVTGIVAAGSEDVNIIEV